MISRMRWPLKAESAGANGSLSNVKHLKCCRSICVSTQYFLEFFASHPEPTSNLSRIIWSIRNGDIELLIV